MKNEDLVKGIRAEVATLRGKGHDAISLAALDSYLERLEALTKGEPHQLDQLALQNARAQLDLQLAQYKRAADQDLEMFRSVISAGLSARRDAMLISGGGAVALLAFAGHLVARGSAGGVVSSLAYPLSWFLGGVLAAALSSGATYLAQSYWRAARNRPGGIFNAIAVGLVILSYVTFIVGGLLGFALLRNVRQ